MKKENRVRRAIKPDAQPFDKIVLETVPRFKESELSGNEWRISISAKFYRNGSLVHATGCGFGMDVAVALLGQAYYRACDNGDGFYAGEEDKCDQEGCSKSATFCYRVKKEFSKENPSEWNKDLDELVIRKFCDQHKTRGDAGFDDSDSNYEQIDL